VTVGKEAEARCGRPPPRPEATLRDALAERSSQHQGVRIDPEGGPAELGLARAEAGVHLEHLRAVRIDSNAAQARAFADAERLDSCVGKRDGRTGVLAFPELSVAGAVRDRQRVESSVAGVRTHAHDRLLDELLDEAQGAALPVGRRDDAPTGLRQARLGEPFSLAQLGGREHGGHRREWMLEAEPRRDSRRRAHGRVIPRGDHAVDALGFREAFQRRLVVDGNDSAPVRIGEPGRGGVAVYGNHEEAAGARRFEQPELRGTGPENEEALHSPPIVTRPRDGAAFCDNRHVSTVLGERVEELRADRNHGGSWMARRAVEALVDVAEQQAASGQELLDQLLSAGRELAASRPGIGAVAGAVGRVLAAAQREGHLETEQLQQVVREEAQSLVDGANRAAASIAIQLQERLTDAVVLTHSASATVREGLLRTPPARVICTVSSPQEEGRAFAEELREAGLEVELVEDSAAPAQLEWASLLLLGADTIFRCGNLCNKQGTRELAEAAADQGVPTVVACEVIKLAPIDIADAPALSDDRDLTAPELIDCVITEEGRFLVEEIAALVDRTPFLREGYALLKPSA
jgi:translation initiation factor 2B subunit (eIF-2B alpha/beta/delta family)